MFTEPGGCVNRYCLLFNFRLRDLLMYPKPVQVYSRVISKHPVCCFTSYFW